MSSSEFSFEDVLSSDSVVFSESSSNLDDEFPILPGKPGRGQAKPYGEPQILQIQDLADAISQVKALDKDLIRGTLLLTIIFTIVI